MAYAPITNSLDNKLNEQPRVDPENEARIQAEYQQQKRNEFYAKKASDENSFHSGLESKTDQGSAENNFDNISKIPDAKSAEKVAAGQGKSIGGLLKELPERKNDLDLEHFKGKKKLGRDKGSMTGAMKDVYKKAKEAKKKSALEKAEGAAAAAISSAVSAVTSELLQQAWLNLIDTWGLTLIYIHFHVLCRFVFGSDLFCKLGHEWSGGKGSGAVSKSAGAAKGAASGSKTAASSFLGLSFDAIGLAEVALLGVIDFLLAVVIFIALIPIIIIAWILVDPAGSFWKLSSTLFGMLYSALTGDTATNVINSAANVAK